MDDEEWIIEDPSESQPEPPPEEPVAEAAEAPAEPEAEQPAEPASTEEKKLVFRHWIRPKFLQYTYMYDYRRNYYDDVIDYLDKRNSGYIREKPQPQTWAERALRTYVSKSGTSFAPSKQNRQLPHVSVGARFQRYYIKSHISRKYSNLGFNTVSI